jgi:small-conductance mechanosensitive channel
MVTALVVTGAVLASTQTGQTLSGIEVSTVLEAIAVLVVAYVVARVVSTLLSALAARLITNRFRVTLLIPVLKFVIYGTGLWVVTTLLFELSTTQLVAFSGLLGAALGLGLKDLMADIFGGLVLVVEQPYRIGDKVSIGDHYGEVVDIGIRSTKLETPDDTLVTVPNYLFFDTSIANANAGAAEMLVSIEFYVDTEADVRIVRQIVEDALITSQYVYVSDDHPVDVVVEDDLYYRTIRGRGYVNDLRNELTFRTDVTERVLDEFAARGIESPTARP